jgi:hypothetical protein
LNFLQSNITTGIELKENLMPLLTTIGKPEKFNSTELAIIIDKELYGINSLLDQDDIDEAQRILEALIKIAEIK